MEEKNKLESLVSRAKEYAEARFDLMLLNLQDKVSDMAASIASVLLMAVFSFFILLFLSIGAAWYIGEQTGNPSMGFFSLAGFYLVLVLVVYFAKDKIIKTPIVNAILKKITLNEQD